MPLHCPLPVASRQSPASWSFVAVRLRATAARSTHPQHADMPGLAWPDDPGRCSESDRVLLLPWLLHGRDTLQLQVTNGGDVMPAMIHRPWHGPSRGLGGSRGTPRSKIRRSTCGVVIVTVHSRPNTMPVTPSGDNKRPLPAGPRRGLPVGWWQSAASFQRAISTHPRHVLPSRQAGLQRQGHHRKRLVGKKWDSLE